MQKKFKRDLSERLISISAPVNGQLSESENGTIQGFVAMHCEKKAVEIAYGTAKRFF